MDIGKELRVIEVEQATVEPDDVKTIEVKEPARSRQTEPDHTSG